MKKLLSLSLMAGISAALLVFLFSKIHFQSVIKVIVKANIIYFFWAFISMGVIYVVCLYRWKMLLDAQDIKVPFKRVLRAFSGGIFFSLFPASIVGGDVARSVDLGMHTKRHEMVVATVLLDRLSGFVGLVIVAIASLAFGARFIDEKVIYYADFFLLILLSVILVVIFSEKVNKRLNRREHKKGSIKDIIRSLHSELYFFRSKPLVLVLNVFYSIIIQAGSSLTTYFILLCLNSGIKIYYPFIINPIVTVISMLPSIGGLGPRDLSSVSFYTKVGLTKDVALAQSLLSFALIVVVGLIGGIIYVFTLHHRRLQPDKADNGIK